jgi:ATP-binding cassette subfamily F protein 3
MRDFTNQQREIETQEVYINRFRANSAKAAGVQSRIKALDKIERLQKPENETTAKFITIIANLRLPEIIMKLENIIVGYDHPLVILPDFIEVHKRDKIGIIGKNGS